MRRPRLRTAFALLTLVVAGVVVARTVPDPVGDIGGDVLYAAATYTALVLVAPRLRPGFAAVGALGWCWAVETLQATGLSAAAADRVPAAAWVLGTGFAWRDLACYALGVAAAWAVDIAARSYTRKRRWTCS